MLRQDEACRVTATIQRQTSALVTISLHDAKAGTRESLTYTPEHPFFVPGAGWAEAGSLGIGTSIIAVRGLPGK